MAGKIKGLTVEIGGDTTKLGEALKSVDKEAKNLQSELKGIETLLKKAPMNVTLLTQKQDVLNQSITATKERLGMLKDAQSKVQEQFDKGEITNEQFRDFQREIINTEQKLKNLAKQAADFGSVISQQIQVAGEKVKEFGEGMVKAGEKFAPVSAAAGAALVLTGKAAIDFESAFAGVQKTVDGTTEQLERMRLEILEMANEIPASTTEISAVAEAAGQLGIQTENVIGFTRTMIDMGAATNMSSEEAATALAKLANITQMSQEDFERLGSSIVALGNNTSATEKDIVDMSLRLAGTASMVGMTEDRIMGLAAGMSSLGINAEAGGGSMSRIMQKINSAVLEGGESLTAYAEMAGQTADEFSRAWQEDAAGALVGFVAGLGRAKDAGLDVAGALKELGISSTQEIDTMLRLSGAGDTLTDALKLSAEAWEENIALSTEAATRYGTTASKMETLKSQAQGIAIQLGDILIPVIRQIIDAISRWMSKFNGLSDRTKKTIVIILAIVSAISPVLIIIGKLIIGIGNLIIAIGKIGPVLKAAGLAVKAFGAALAANPIGIIIAAVAALVAIFIYLWNNCEGFRNFWINLWEIIKNAALAAWEWIKNAWTSAGEFFVNLWQGIKDVFWGGINWIVSTFQNAKDAVIGFFAGIWGGIKGAWQGVTTWFTGLFASAVEGVKNIWNSIIGFFKTLWQGIISVLEFLGIKDFIFSVFGVAYDIVVSIWNVAGLFFAWVWEKIKAVFVGVVGFFKSIFMAAWEAVKTVWGAVADWFRGVWETIVSVWQVVSAWFSGIFTAAWEGIKAAWSVVTDWFRALWYAIVLIFSVVISFYVGIFTKAWQGIQAVWSAVKGWFAGIWDGIKNVFAPVVSWFGSTFTAAWGAIKNAFSALGEFFSGLFNKVKETFLKIGVIVADSITSTLKAAVNKAIGFVENVINTTVGLINRAIDMINKIPGVKIRELVGVNFPRLRRGGILEEGQAMVAEAGSPEMVSMMNGKAVVTPLTQRDKMRVLGERDGQSVFMPDNTPILDKLEQMLDVLARFLPQNELQMVLDTGVLVGELTPRIDRRMSMSSDLKKRGR